MSIVLRGHTLNQRQLDAIVLPINEYMQGKIKGARKFEQACVDALETAGCPLGYDTGIDPSQTMEQRAQNWIVNGRVGQSSKAIWSHMMGIAIKNDGFGVRYPLDPDDLNRCLLLLDLLPEWVPRIDEMAQYNKQWAALVADWDQIVDSFLDEVGLDWSKAKSAPRTYQLMQTALSKAEAA